MTKPSETAKMVLANTLDQDLAVSAVLELGTEVEEIAPQIRFSGKSLLALRKSPAAVVAWMVGYSAAPELEQIALADRRQCVNAALAANPYLTEPGRAAPASSIDENELVGVIANERRQHVGLLARWLLARNEEYPLLAGSYL